MSSSGLKPAKWKDLPKDPKPPLRNGDFGTEGRDIELNTNFFPVEIKGLDASQVEQPKKSKRKGAHGRKKGNNRQDICPDGLNTEFVHYNVVIEECRTGRENKVDKFVDVDDLDKFPRGFPKRKRMDIFEEMKKSNPDVFNKGDLAFDRRKNAVGAPDNPELSNREGRHWTVEVIGENGRKNNYRVKLNPVNRHSLRDYIDELRGITTTTESEQNLTVTQMIDIMFRHMLSLKYLQCGRNSFFPKVGEFDRPTDTGDGMESMVGFFGALRSAQWKNGSLLLNVDPAHAEFYKEQSVIDFLKENISVRNLDSLLKDSHREKIEGLLSGIKIRVTHSNIPRTYKVTAVLSKGADKKTFPKNGTNTTVENYFLEDFSKELCYPKLNCLHVGPLHRTIYLPMEVCRISKGQQSKKTTDKRMRNMIKSTAVRPQKRLEQTKQIVREIADNPFMKAIGFSIADEPLSVTGRILPAPQIQMTTKISPSKGKWEPIGQCFYQAGKLECWGVVNYVNPNYLKSPELTAFLEKLKGMARTHNMTIEDPCEVFSVQGTGPKPEIDLVEFKRKYPKIQLIIIVLKKEKDLYGQIKLVGDKQINVVTSCIDFNIAIKATTDPSIMFNFLSKINSKIGGTNNIIVHNSQLLVLTKPVIIMGADVNHPPARDKSLQGDDGGLPSLAAIVGSLDRFASRYAVQVRKQEARKEIITDMKDMVKNILKAFYVSTNRKPERIIMYRDGVSNSEFLSVLRYELKAMRDACTEWHLDYKPGITFIVVQKRHHTRLYAKYDKDAIGKSRNVPPGTTVDHSITHPNEKDWYTVSHEGIQGTSKPTHYYVMWDDNDLTMDQLQGMTYAMCHLYANCPRSVSLPAPAYYAHRVAFRAKTHHEAMLNSDGSSVSSDSLSDSDINQSAGMGTDNPMHLKHYFL